MPRKIKLTKVQKWLNISNSRVEESWNLDNLQEISFEDRYLYSAISESNENLAISFVFNESNSVEFAFVTESVFFEDYLLSKFYDLNGNLVLAVKLHNDGELTVESISAEGRVEGYWSNASDCFSRFHTFTGNSIADWGISAIFNAASAGLYSPVVAAACLAAAPAMK